MKPNEIVDLVEQLNYELYDSCKNLVENYGLCFEFKTCGYVHCIEFLGMVVWNSEDDPRDYTENDEYEDLEVYLRRISQVILEKLCKVKL